MFTGIIEEIGTIKAISSGSASAILSIGATKVLEDVHLGDSIAVNGVCLTVTSFTATSFTADVMHETLVRSSLKSLKSGDKVNLERAMSANGRFGGHIVAGHVDGLGNIRDIEQDDNAIWYTISAPAEILRYIVEKGSIAIDGISLTVAYVDNHVFKVSIIPHTASHTTLYYRKAGDIVNLENDCVGKYIEKFMQPYNDNKEKTKSNITAEFLLQNGF